MPTTVLSMLAAAGAGANAAPPAWLSYLPFVAMGLIFWFLIMRPQMKQQKEQKAKLEGIKKGDEVLTGGGFVGRVISVDENYVNVEIAQGVRVKAVKSTIADVIPPAGSKPAND
ncbi:preprotein translocase subunit YajC [Novosphingobium sp. 9U]|uniref:preprotein translocase subunit YajC n=1 Tax=Novosphingobium sp. 9U TaxID=2653158 RepID=UPI0012F0DB59|nr:preprotein translocase subunit YajC [Novosphingobium sp. 9U]VWX51345.1 SecYEG protein translocase auxillary subunit [Novosphingobium sp. 9U]